MDCKLLKKKKRCNLISVESEILKTIIIFNCSFWIMKDV